MAGKSDLVRRIAIQDYVNPALSSKRKIEIRQGDLKAKLVPMGFPARNANQIGTSLEAEKFWRPLGLRLLSPKNQSRAADTVYEFEFAVADSTPEVNALESPEARAERVVNGLKGILKDEIASFGGAEAFMRWVRSEDEDEAA